MVGVLAMQPSMRFPCRNACDESVSVFGTSAGGIEQKERGIGRGGQEVKAEGKERDIVTMGGRNADIQRLR